MDLHSVMETFAEAWVAANTQTPLTEAAGEPQPSSPPSPSGPTIPIRCVIERQPSCAGLDGPDLAAGSGSMPSVLSSSTDRQPASSNTGPLSSSTATNSSNMVEQNAFAIIPSGALFADMVRTALTRLGYSATEAVGAKGFIQIRNWKPLTFDQITDANEATVSDVLGDISSHVTLRIRLFRPKGNAAHDLKDKLLQILLAHSYSLLVNTDCPIDQRLLTTLCGKGSRNAAAAEYEISEDTRKKFDQWYLQQVFNHYRQVATLAAAQAQQQGNGAPPTPRRVPNGHGAPVQLTIDVEPHHVLANGPTILERPTSHLDHAIMNGQNGISPPSRDVGQQQFARTRIRTSFDPELELPKLHKWFAENQHPSRAQIQQYVKELNALESRRGRKPLDVNNVVYWFKNARAAHKRQELKFVNGAHSPGKGNGLDGKDSKEGISSLRGGLDENGHEDGFESGDHDDSGGEDDNFSHFSQTLDLSMRPIKRRRSDNSSSPCHSPNGAHNERISASVGDKEETPSDEDDDESDLEEKYFYSGGLQGVGGAAAYGASNGNGLEGSNGGAGNGPLNGNGVYSGGYGHAIGNAIGMHHQAHPDSPEGADARRIRRSRTFIDPMTEVPRLEQWFTANTHPTHSQIVRYTDDLNSLPYRQKFPKLEPKNIQFWFKNRRAKYKRLSLPSQVHPTPSALLGLPGSNGPEGTASSPQTSASSVTSTSSSQGAPTGGRPSPPPPVTSALNIERLIGH